MFTKRYKHAKQNRLTYESRLRYRIYIFRKVISFCSEKLVTRQVSAMKAHQMAALGYEYILLSDGWMAKTRSSDGKLQVDQDRFPNGLKSVADAVNQTIQLHHGKLFRKFCIAFVIANSYGFFFFFVNERKKDAHVTCIHTSNH